MIKDKLSNAKIYYGLSESIKKGLEWLEKTDFKNLSDGKIEIDGDKIFASVQTYFTREEAKYETHKKYIDIQYMIDGVENVGYADITDCISAIDYDSDKDLEFYDIKTEEEYTVLETGEFVIFYPHDAHKPSMTKDIQRNVKKVVVKVSVN